MNKTELGKWLFIYFLLISLFFGFFLILFGKTLMRIDDPMGVFFIFVPTMAGQITILFKWFADRAPNNSERKKEDKFIDIPKFIVKTPPILVLIMFLIAILTKIIGFKLDAVWTPSDDQLKGVVTFGISILNATTIYLVSKFFK